MEGGRGRIERGGREWGPTSGVAAFVMALAGTRTVEIIRVRVGGKLCGKAKRVGKYGGVTRTLCYDRPVVKYI